MDNFEQYTLPTYVRDGLFVLFCGINPGRISAMKGYHYANPANLFWRGLHVGGLTPYQLKPEDTGKLMEYGYGITDLVSRPSRSSSDLRNHDFEVGAKNFYQIVETYKPKIVCFNGITAFRHGIGQKKGTVAIGLQSKKFFGNDEWEGCYVYVIPSTSGANANFTREERLEAFVNLGIFLRQKGWIL